MLRIFAISPSKIRCVSRVAVCLLLSSLASDAQTVAKTDPVGYIPLHVTGGTALQQGMTFVSPTLANPVQWQGRLTAVNGSTLTVENADWQAGAWGPAYCLEITSGLSAGFWTEIISASGSELTVSEPMDGLLAGDETVRIRRFTTLADFLGAQNEAGLKSATEIAFADVVTVYHRGGSKSYWYYDGSEGGAAGWFDAAWNEAANAIIAPGEGVVLRRVDPEPLAIFQLGAVKSGAQSVFIQPQLNVIGGVIPVGLKLKDSNLHTGSGLDGIAGGTEPAFADSVVIYGEQTRTYWYYNGADGGTAGWMDASWNFAGDTFIPGGATFVVNRKDGDSFIWTILPFVE